MELQFSEQIAEMRRSKDEEIQKARQQASEASVQQAALLKQKRELEERENALDLDLERKLAEERTRWRETELRGMQERSARESDEKLKQKDDDIAIANRKLDEAAAKEVDLVKRAREFEERERRTSIEAEKRIAEEVARFREEDGRVAREAAERELNERIRVKDLELDAVNRRLAEASKTEAEVIRLSRQLEQSEAHQHVELERKLAEQAALIRASERKSIEERFAKEAELKAHEQTEQVAALRSQLASAANNEAEALLRVRAAEDQEAEVLRLKRELEDREQQQQLHLERSLAEQTKQIRETERNAMQERLQREVENKTHAHSQAMSEMRDQLAEASKRTSEAQDRVKAALEKETEVLRLQRQIEERAQAQQAEVERQLAEQTKLIRETERNAMQERLTREVETKTQAHDQTLADMRDQLAEAAKVAADAQDRAKAAVGKEAEVLRLQRKLEEREEMLQADIDRRLAEQANGIREAERRAVEERLSVASELKAHEQAQKVEQLQKQLEDAAAKETEFLRLSRERDAFEQRLKLDGEQRLTDESAKIREQFAKLNEQQIQTMMDKQRLADAEKDEQLERMKRHTADLQRAIDVRSQQLQGEAQEVVLRELLARSFPFDLVEDVDTGAIGADVMQRVRRADGMNCGTIVWECKRTKTWSDGWLAKLRDDQRETRSSIAVIVSETLPANVRHFEFIDGVWVCSWQCAQALAAVLRAGLMEVAQVRTASEGRGDKMQILYGYMTGPEFKTRITGIVEAFTELQDDLYSERRAMLARWKKREKHLERAFDNVTSLYGDLQGIAGTKLADLPALSLSPHLLDASDDHDDDREDDPQGHEAADDHIELLYTLLPIDGTAVGNGSLTKRFVQEIATHFGVAVDQRDYDACKKRLLAAGRARKGPGRGGALARENARGAGPIPVGSGAASPL
jgi:hypothetical protein